MKIMKHDPIICAAAKFAYNKESNGISYEYQTIYKSLNSVFPDTKFIDVYHNSGVDKLISYLVSLPKDPRPRVLYIPFLGVLGPSELNKIRSIADVGIFYLDDTWRQDLVSAYFNYCDWFTTSDPKFKWRYDQRLFKNIMVKMLLV